ncbi:Uncharacterised protein [Chlamydia abortus]|nr:Uncharacterised protein [Chlamydia trachomatis]SFW07340.1 Uncharacterised protein [Chlamydia abortus]
MAQASDLQAKLLPSYLAIVKTIKRGAQPAPCSLIPLSSHLSLTSLSSSLSLCLLLPSLLPPSPLSLFLLSTFSLSSAFL